MDPNANLAELLELAREVQAEEDRSTEDGCCNEEREAACAVRMAELVIALDEWICRGGFLPQRWTGAR